MNKLYLIIITHALNVQIDTLKAHLGYENMVQTDTVGFVKAQYINSGVCIGKYGDNILIVDPYRVIEFYNKDISVYESNICKLFPKSQILALNLNSVVDMYGYSITREGKRVRTKWSADSDIYIDIGEKIPEEKDIDNEMGPAVPARLLIKYLGNESEWGNIMLREYK